MGRLMTALSAMVTDVADQAELPAPPLAAARAVRPDAAHTVWLDKCRLGPHWCAPSLPPPRPRAPLGAQRGGRKRSSGIVPSGEHRGGRPWPLGSRSGSVRRTVSRGTWYLAELQGCGRHPPARDPPGRS